MIAAYCWPQSALAGDTVALAISSDVDFCDIELVRVGATDLTVARFEDVAVTNQPTPADASTKGCSWEETMPIQIEASWKSGFYLVKLTDQNGEQAFAFFVVKATAPSTNLLVLSTSTWAAYNTWGGPSYYLSLIHI